MERRDVLRSKKAIKNAFIELSIHYDISKITVNRVLEKANVSRGTFYAHFTDIYDLKNKVEEDYLNDCREVLAKSDLRMLSKDPFPQVLYAVRFLFSHAETIKAQAAADNGNLFINSFRNALKQSIYQAISESSDPTAAHIKAACVSDCIVDGSVEAILNDPNYLSARDKTAKIISSYVANM